VVVVVVVVVEAAAAAATVVESSSNRVCLCVFCVGPLCGPPLWWWVLCGTLPSVWVPCVGPLCGSPVWVPCVGPLCVGPLCGSPVWVPRRAASCGIYSRDVSRSFTRSRSELARGEKACGRCSAPDLASTDSAAARRVRRRK